MGAGAHDEGRVVLDQEHPRTRGGQLAHQGAERLGLLSVQARGRLVQEQHPRLARHRSSQLD